MMVTLPIRHVFFGSCPTNLTSTEATTWSHSERVAYAAFLSGGKMLLTIMCTLYILVLFVSRRTCLLNQSPTMLGRVQDDERSVFSGVPLQS